KLLRGIADGYVGRPCNIAIGAVRVEELRVDIVRGISRIQPHRINPAVGCDSDGSEPMPFATIDWIIIDSHRSAEALAAIGAAREHHVRSAARTDAGYHVNVVIGSAARPIDSKEDLSGEPAGIDRAAKNQAAAHVNCGDLVKSWRDTRVLCVARPNAPKTAAGIPATDKKVAIARHIERSPLRRIGNADRSLPRCSAISRTTESSELASEGFGPKL